MPKFLESNPNEPKDYAEYNQRLNKLQPKDYHDVNVTSDQDGNTDHGTKRTHLNVKSDEENVHSKRQRIETAMKLQGSFRLPSFRIQPVVTARPAESTGEKKSSSVPKTSCEKASSCFKTPIIPSSSGSDVSKQEGVISERPEVVKVSSFGELMSSSQRKTQTEEKRKEVMIKSEVTTDSISMKKPARKRNVSLLERFTEEEIKLHLLSLEASSSHEITLFWPSQFFFRVCVSLTLFGLLIFFC